MRREEPRINRAPEARQRVHALANPMAPAGR